MSNKLFKIGSILTRETAKKPTHLAVLMPGEEDFKGTLDALWKELKGSRSLARNTCANSVESPVAAGDQGLAGNCFQPNGWYQ